MSAAADAVDATSVGALDAQGAVARGENGSLFLPHRFRRVRVIKWLRRTHGWFALWGGVVGMLFGATGILLNHRAVMKIPAVQIERSTIQLPLGDASARTPAELASWLQTQLDLDKPAARLETDPPQYVPWGNRSVEQPAQWRVFFSSPKRTLQAEYWVGNRFVTVKRTEGNVFYLLTRLHMGQGVHPGWILLADTISGSLIVLALTGLLLWSRLHGPRLLALGLLAGSLGGLSFLGWIST
ncbi:MAG: PepSY-associated TM helix domain-containing protein [Betaproteobacteria bacterium]|nr:PepSY-associated TM helix domain-containing protein [Betaproteobacteria bacterium]